MEKFNDIVIFFLVFLCYNKLVEELYPRRK